MLLPLIFPGISMLTANATELNVKQKLANFYSRFPSNKNSKYYTGIDISIEILIININMFFLFRVASMYGFSPSQ